jgi:hypothetical protein
MAQSVTSATITEVTENLEMKLCRKWIKFPHTNEEKLRLKEKFYAKYNVPGTIGAVDGTHVEIIAPVEAENVFVNRKYRHSIDVMLVNNKNYYL